MKRILIPPLALAAVLAGGAVKIVQDQCGPFTDVTPAFCPYVSELYYLGITAGTSATTFSPDDPLTRGQAAVFVAKGLNQSLARSSRRAALGQWWTTQSTQALGRTVIDVNCFGAGLGAVTSDGTDLWVVGPNCGSVYRVRGSTGKLLETWTLNGQGSHVLAAMGRIFVTQRSDPGALRMIDPSQLPGQAVIVADALGASPNGMAFDGSRIWTANGIGSLGPGSVSIVTPGEETPWAAVTVETGFAAPTGVLFDGHSVWVTDFTAGTLLRLDSNAAILHSVPVGMHPEIPVFDGANIWVPSSLDNSVSVVQAATGQVIATLTGNGLNIPEWAAFDGERVMVVSVGDTVSLWRAADLTPLGSVNTGNLTLPIAACSDGINFWITLQQTNELVRF